MDLNKDNVKKILGIITFTLVLLAVLMNMGAVGAYLGFLWGILFPHDSHRKETIFQKWEIG